MKIPYNRTKIVATIGPASRSREVLTGLFRSGLDIARINFSHGSHEDHLETIELIRELNQELGTSVGILADLQGPKIRIGDVAAGTIVTEKSDASSVGKECGSKCSARWEPYH